MNKRETKPEKQEIVAVSPLTGATLTKKQSSKGGKAITDRKIIANSINTRKYCNNSCKLWPCPYMYLSHSSMIKGKCALKQLPHRTQIRIERLYLKGEFGVIQELRNIIIKLAEYADTENNIDALKDYFKALTEYIKIVYGEKTRLSAVLKEENEERLTTRDIMRIIRKADAEMEAEKQKKIEEKRAYQEAEQEGGFSEKEENQS